MQDAAGFDQNRRVRREYRMSLLKKFLRDERGASAIEYAIIAAGVAVVIAVAVNDVGTKNAANFSTVSNSLK